MLFNSLKFAAFFPAVALAYWVLPHKLRNWMLLAASYVFYMCWNPQYALLMLFSTAITWAAGLIVSRSQTTRGKKWAVGLSLAANLSVLALFKYASFAIENINAIRQSMGLAEVGAGFNLLLPVGISFYIFQAIGYTIDVYRGDVQAERSFATYALFVSFFPQLVAGPIERSANMLPQFKTVHHFSYDEAKAGLVQMLWGYIQKMILADRLALLVDAVYQDPSRFGTVPLLLGVVFFALQLYCDFSSYSDIAIGAARVMGFGLMRNFDSPYLARSIGEFWDTWHISLSSWFQDYLYIPLGGSRKGLARTCINLMIVFLVSGLWHGAAWTFVLWGAMHGAYTVLSRLTRDLRTRLCAALHIDRQSTLHQALCVLLTFTFTSLAFVVFRAETPAQAFSVFSGLFRWDAAPFAGIGFEGLGIDAQDFWVAIAAAACLILCDFLRKRKGPLTPLLLKKPLSVQWPVLLAGILLLTVFGMYGAGYVEKPFIYFQF